MAKSRYQEDPLVFVSLHSIRSKIYWYLIGISVGVFGCLLLSIYILWHILGNATAQPGKIYIKSEMTKQQIKSLNVLQPIPEKLG